MNKLRNVFVCVLLLLFVFPLGWASAKKIEIDGSSTVFPILEAMAEEFQKAQKGRIIVTVGVSGTGGGMRKFCRGEVDIVNASRPISKSEIEACRAQGIEFIELPIAYDGLAVVVNPKNDWVKSLSVADLRRIWEPAAHGKIMTWQDIRPEWPKARLRLFGPGADSGTFDYFTEAIVGKARASRGDFTGSEDDNVLVMGVAGDRYAFGYFGLAFYEENRARLRIVPIDGGRGPVYPTEKTVMDGTYRPLSRPLFLYLNRKALARPEVMDFMQFSLKNAPRLIREARFVPLTSAGYRLVTNRLAAQTTGSVFSGKDTVGVSIEDLLK